MKLKIILFITLLFLSGCSNSQKNELKQEETNKVVETEENETNDEISEENPTVNTQVDSSETQSSPKQEKHICNDNDEGYVNWLNNLSKTYDTLRFYDSFDDAYNDGDRIARKYLYGFFISPAPYEYSDDICEAKVYSINLYVPKKLCEDNEAIYLPNNISFENGNGISAIQYLKNLGYACTGKN